MSLSLGYRAGRYYRRKDPEGDRGGSGDIALTAMYALLGLVLAFTYSFTMSRYDLRKQAILHEANAIGTAFLRADLAAEPERSELRRQLRDYAETRRVNGATAGTPELARSFVAKSHEALQSLWPLTSRIVRDGGADPVHAAIMTSVNEVIDLHAIRLNAAFDRLPSVVLWMLLFLAGATLAVTGYNRGLVGSMNRVRLSILALVLAGVITLITDFDRGLHGLIRLSQAPMNELIRDLDAMLSTEEQ